MSNDKFREDLTLVPDQLFAARGLLNRMTQRELAEAAGVSERAIAGFEAGETVPHNSTLQKIREALERRGIEFSNGGNPGVKLIRDKATIPT